MLLATLTQAKTLNKAITDGTNWSTTGTWSMGRLPASGDSIVIPSGYTVWLDISATLNNVALTIGGTLEIDKNSVLALDNTSTITILSGGILSTTHPSSTEIAAAKTSRWTGRRPTRSTTAISKSNAAWTAPAG